MNVSENHSNIISLSGADYPAILTDIRGGILEFNHAAKENFCQVLPVDKRCENITDLFFAEILHELSISIEKNTNFKITGFAAVVYFANLAKWDLKRYQLNLSENFTPVYDVLIQKKIISKNNRIEGFLFSFLEVGQKISPFVLDQMDHSLRMLFENTEIGIYRTTPDGRIFYVNQAILNMLGFDSLEELQIRNLEAEGFAAGFERSVFKQRMISEKSVQGFESIWLHKSGQKTYIRESARVIEDASGNIVYFEGIVENITKTKIAEKSLEEKERNYQMLIDNSGLLFVEIDSSGIIIYANAYAFRQLGYKKNEVIGKPLQLFFSAEEYYEIIHLRKRKGVSKVKKSSGEYLYLSYDINHVYRDDDQLVFVIVATDITQQFLAQDALLESEKRFRNLAEATDEGICILQGKVIIDTNNQFCSMTGLSREFIIGEHFCDFIKEISVVDELLDSEKLQGRVRVSIKTTNDRFTPVELNVKKVPKANFGSTYISIRNIQQEIDLKMHQEYYHSRLMMLHTITMSVIGELELPAMVLKMLVEIKRVFAVDACVVRVIEDNNLVLMSQVGMPEDKIQKIFPIGFGIANEIISGRKPLTIYNTDEDRTTKPIKNFHPNAYQFVSYAGAPLLVREKVLGILGIFSEEMPRTFSDDELEQLQISANHIAVAIENNSLFSELKLQKGLLEREIVERHDMELELEGALDFTEYIMNSIPYAIVVFDSEFHVLSSNARSGDFAESDSVYETRERDFFKAFPGLQFLRNFLHNAVELNTYHADSVSKVDEFGNQTHYSVTVYPMLRQSQSGFILIVEDITEQKKMDQHLIQSEKMISIAGLAAGMAHEINNPLGSILQGCQNIERRISTELTRNIDIAARLHIDIHTVQQYLAVRQVPEILLSIKEAATKASSIIKSMLNFSRSGDSKFVEADINILIDRVLNLASNDYDMKKKYDFRKLNVLLELAENLPNICIIVTEIEQVLFNLIRNATQALRHSANNEKSPSIVIRTFQKSNMLCIEVEDNGPGIPKEYQKRVFEPFFTTKDVGEGTGLGLSVSYMIVNTNHKGHLYFSTVPGEGTKFTIELPIKQQ